MRSYLELGSTPAEEACASVGAEGYGTDSRAECRRYRDLLATACPIPEGIDAEYRVKGFSHDFGEYREVVVSYPDNDDQAEAFAFWVEDQLPATWSDDRVRTYSPEAVAPAR